MYIIAIMISVLSVYSILEWHATSILASSVPIWFSAFVIRLEKNSHKPKLRRVLWALIPMAFLFIFAIVFNPLAKNRCKI